MRARVHPTLWLTLTLASGCGATGMILDEDVADVLSADALPDPGDAPTLEGAIDVSARRDALAEVEGDGSADVAGPDSPRLDAGQSDVGVREVGLADVGTGDARAVDVGAPRDASGRDGGCPSEMVLVEGRVCVDRWEGALEAESMDGGVTPWSPYENPGSRVVRAVSRAMQVPQGYITGEQSARACAAAGKRLCALSEWLAACRGPSSRIYPYGNSYERRRCNEARTPHPVVQFFGTSSGVFTFTNMNNPGINMQPNTLAPTGAFTGCESSWGIFDMVGNLHEWIADPAGTFKGGFYVDAEINGRGCLYTTTAHSFTYRDYSTGFRCCADPR